MKETERNCILYCYCKQFLKHYDVTGGRERGGGGGGEQCGGGGIGKGGEHGGGWRRRRRMKITISEPPTTLHRSSRTSKEKMENISVKKVDVKFSLFMPNRHTGKVEVSLLHSFPMLALVGSAVNCMPLPLYFHAKNSQHPVDMRPGQPKANLGISERRNILYHWQVSNHCTSSQ